MSTEKTKVKSTQEVFEAIGDEDLLSQIAEVRRIDTGSKPSKKRIIRKLVDEVQNAGFLKMLSILNQALLIKIGKTVCDKDEEHTRSKPVLTKRISDAFREMGAKDLLKSLSKKNLNGILKSLDLENEEGEAIDLILKECEEIGLENVLSSVSESTLVKCVNACGLKCLSHSMDVLLSTLMEQKIQKTKKQGKNSPNKAKQKTIQKGISDTDLTSYYTLNELREWMVENKVPNPTLPKLKSEVASYIIKFLNGEELPQPKPSTGRGGRKRKAPEPKLKTPSSSSSSSSESGSSEDSGSDSSSSESSKHKSKKDKKDDKKDKKDDKKEKTEEKKDKSDDSSDEGKGKKKQRTS